MFLSRLYFYEHTNGLLASRIIELVMNKFRVRQALSALYSLHITDVTAGVWIPPRLRFSVSFVRGTAIEPGMRCRRPRDVEIGIKSSGRR
jgi:hypothetical protein